MTENCEFWEMNLRSNVDVVDESSDEDDVDEEPEDPGAVISKVTRDMEIKKIITRLDVRYVADQRGRCEFEENTPIPQEHRIRKSKSNFE
jgi:hypothetical protein